MANFEIYQITDQELEELVIISRQTFIETFSSQNTEENLQKYLNEQMSREKLMDELNNKNSEFYFMNADQKLAGYLKLNFGAAQTELRDDQAMEIERIYVLKEFQGLGLGKKLLEKAIATGLERKSSCIWLGVWEKNHKAIGFYKKNGFIAFDQHSFVLGHEVQNDLMMKWMLK